ncbi:MAG: choice-of-anchor J domain-containing protein [Paludibacteraceae bacterium]|nr:choice-of-anchor J domain-containing protein [Paludibacteraceae bacterium]
MKKVLFFFASVLMLASCENFYIDQNLGGSEYNPTDVRTVDYTLTDADYKNIVTNKDNIAIAEATLVADSLGVVDSTEYKAFLQIATDLAFNKVAMADVYVPAFLTAKFPQFSKGSLFNITYKNCEGAPEYLTTFASTTKYTLSTADYETIWGEGKGGIYYLTPATMMGLTSVLPAEAEEGAILAVVYEYKDTEPSFGGGNNDAPKGFFDGTPESRGFYTTSEAIAAVDAGNIVKDDSIKVGGIISRWFKKSGGWDTYHSVSFFVMDPVSGMEHEFEFYNCYTLNQDIFATYEFTDQYNAICIDSKGREFHLGDTVVGAGKYTIYNGTHELNTNCYLTEWRPVSTASAAPKKAAAAANGKKTVLYQYTEGKWKAYKNDAATVVALPEDVYSALGKDAYVSDKNKNVLTTFLAQEYPYAQAGQAYTVVYVSTKESAYNAIEFVYDGATFVENLGISYTTTAFSLSDVWGSTIYYKQAIIGEGQGKLIVQNVLCDPPLTRVWYYSDAYGMCASGFDNTTSSSYECEAWLVTPQIDLSRAKNPQLSFDQAFNKASNFTEEAAVFVSTNYTGDVTDKSCQWIQLDWDVNEDGTLNVPAGTTWTFQPSGNLDMAAFVGEKVHVAFRYKIVKNEETGTTVSGTWEIKNLLLSEPEN